MKNVLIAEDSSVIQNLTKKILEFQNFNIDIAKNGEQVLDKLKKNSYDILLLDINMPVMDGIQCARLIRQQEEGKDEKLPIVAITGNAKGYRDEDFKDAGIDEVLAKPLDFDALVETVNRITGNVGK